VPSYSSARPRAHRGGTGGEAGLRKFWNSFQGPRARLAQARLRLWEGAGPLPRLAAHKNGPTRAITKSAPELNRLAVASEVLQLLAKFVRDRFPAHATAFMEVLEPFGEELVKVYG